MTPAKRPTRKLTPLHYRDTNDYSQALDIEKENYEALDTYSRQLETECAELKAKVAKQEEVIETCNREYKHIKDHADSFKGVNNDLAALRDERDALTGKLALANGMYFHANNVCQRIADCQNFAKEVEDLSEAVEKYEAALRPTPAKEQP